MYSYFVGNALSDATTPLNAFRIIQLLGSFQDRPVMQKKIKESHSRIIGLAQQDLTNCSDVLKTNQRSESDIVSSVQRMLQISKRIKGHVIACQNIGIPNDDANMKRLHDKYQHLENYIRHQIGHVLEQWTTRMNSIIIAKKLFFIDVNGRMHSGADVNMAQMICECYRLQKALDSTPPPTWQTWIALYQSIKLKMKLVDIIVSCYNGVEAALTPSIRDLLEPRLKSVKEEIAQLNEYENCNWDSHDQEIVDNLKLITETTLKLYQSMKKFQSTSETIQQMANSWSKTLLIEYQDGFLPTGELVNEHLAKKYQEFATSSKKIAATVEEAQKLMADLQPSDWLTYLEMIDRLILDGIVKNIKTTYTHFYDHGLKNYIYELQIKISAEDGIRFNPSLDCEETNMGILQQFSSLMIGITKIASHINSLSGTVQFQNEVDANESITTIQEEIISRISNSVSGMTKAAQQLEQFSFLWETDHEIFLAAFIQFGYFLGDGTPGPNTPPNPAVLKDYKDQLEKLSQWKKDAYSTIKDLEKIGKSFKLKLSVKPAIEVREIRSKSPLGTLLTFSNAGYTRNYSDLESHPPGALDQLCCRERCRPRDFLTRS